MKNAERDELLRLAREIWTSVPQVMMDGSGYFYATNGSIVPTSDLLAALYRCRVAAQKLLVALEAIPPRKAAVKV